MKVASGAIRESPLREIGWVLLSYHWQVGVRSVGGAGLVGAGLFGLLLALLALELSALAAVEGGGRFQSCAYGCVRAPSLSLSPGGGEIGVRGIFLGG